MITKTTFMIKTFLRPAALSVLVNSILRYYPHNPIVIVNDGDKPFYFPNPNINCINTEFDIGLSAGRNLGVMNVETPYFVLLDDDFEFTEQTRIENFCEVMKEVDADIVIGAVDNVVCGNFLFENKTLCREEVSVSRKKGYVKVDCGPNFFLAKTEAVKRVLWDESLKLIEHWDFFLRAKQAGLNVYYTNRVYVKHNKDKYITPEYKHHKHENKKLCRDMAFQKHGMKTNAFWIHSK